MNVIQALDDPSLFADHFPGDSWQVWRVFLKTLFALPLTPAETETYRAATGRSLAPKTPAVEAWVIAGRRSGKSRIAALVATYLAAFRKHPLARGERGVLPIISVDRRASQAVLGYVQGLFEVPMLARMIESTTAETITLTNRVTIEVRTSSFRSVRGITAVAAVVDEVAFLRADDSATPDLELVRALKPAMSTVKGAVLLGISSPYSRRGVLFSKFKRHFGKDGPVLVWKAATRVMNPSLDESIVTEALADDPEAGRSEYLAEFRSDLSPYLPLEAIEACVIDGRHELPRAAETRYEGFLDASGGSQDSFCLGIAHTDGDHAVLDLLREVTPPFSPEQVVGEFAQVLKSYGLHVATADKFAGVWVTEMFAKHGVHVAQAAEPKSTLYGALLPLVMAGRCELLDNPKLITQLASLERRTGRSGKDSIAEPPGAHDDLANVCAGALVAAAPGVGSGVPAASGLAATAYTPVNYADAMAGSPTMDYAMGMISYTRERWLEDADLL